MLKETTPIVELSPEQLELVSGGGRPEAAGHYGGSRSGWGGGNRNTPMGDKGKKAGNSVCDDVGVFAQLDGAIPGEVRKMVEKCNAFVESKDRRGGGGGGSSKGRDR
ncbi:MAG: hypothetical protein IPK59_08185 [Rhodospirillaceae bacterium]|nr:hypothetical protein [Rhodospirillaceae bacterium]